MNIIFFLVLICFTETLASVSYQEIDQRFALKTPTRWAEIVPGVKTSIETQEKIVALTLDACGSRHDGCDYRLINFLIAHHIPATIFVTSRWITLHPDDFSYLLQYPSLFAIENHGLLHRPCSVNGQSIYGIKGTNNIKELIEEVEDGALFIEQRTGRKPRYYRSGTAYYDDIAAAIVQSLGYEIVGFSVLGDAGATFTQEQTVRAVASAKPGSIIILHMNHPEKPAGKGAIKGIASLIKQGYRFVHLSEITLQ